MTSTKINIKNLENDLKKQDEFEEKITHIFSEKIAKRKDEIEREKKVIFDRFISTLNGKEIFLENFKSK